jgi:hypothetical protein
METKIYKAKNKETGTVYLVEALTLAGSKNIIAEYFFDLHQASAKDALDAVGSTVLKALDGGSGKV